MMKKMDKDKEIAKNKNNDQIIIIKIIMNKRNKRNWEQLIIFSFKLHKIGFKKAI